MKKKILKRKTKKRNKTKKYVVTAAQRGANVNVSFLNTLLNYCSINKAELIVIPLQSAHDNLKQYKDLPLSDLLQPYGIYKDRKLNSNIEINTLPIYPTAMNPLTSLQRLGDCSQIYGATKLSLEVIPNSNYKLPKVVMTTGVVTKPFYDTTKRRGRIAELDHKYSAVVIEVVDDNEYHFRQLEANKKGEVTDLCQRYSANEVNKVRAEALMLGDWHSGETDPVVKKVTLEEIIPTLDPKRIFFDDLFNGCSVNHHEDKNLIILAKKSMEGKKNLTQELIDTETEINEFIEKTDADLFVKASNHDDFLTRYIEEGRFIKDPENIRVSAELLCDLIDTKDEDPSPLQIWLGKRNKLPNRIRFLKIDEDYKIAKIQLANHGHLGANGAFGSVRAQELACQKSFVGHSHSPYIGRGVWRVGTSTLLKLSYNRGPSSWVNTHGIVYGDGTRQLINIIIGKWRG